MVSQQQSIVTLSPTRRRPLGLSPRELFRTALAYALLFAGTAALMIPFFWMLSTSLKSMDEVQAWPIIWIPRQLLWDNYLEVFRRITFARFMLNSLILSVGGITGTLISSSLAGYGFARMRFPGREGLFFLNLTVLMLPAWVVIVPHFMMFKAVGWLDTFLPIIVPSFFGNAFHIFLFRQFFLGIPVELEEAARIDGCSFLRTFLQVFLPLSKPVIATVALFAFFYYWNDLLYPLVYFRTQTNFPVSLGMRLFQQAAWGIIDYRLMMAAALMSLAPCVVLFFAAQRLFIQGVVITGVEK